MTEAQCVAWNVYMERLQVIVLQQRDQFAANQSACGLSIAAPTQKQVEIIQAAIDKAVREAKESAISTALVPIVAALDAIDNSHTKSETVKSCREGIQCAYDKLHALKSAATEVTRSSDAVPE